MIGISQSGESTDTNVVLEKARAGGAVTVGITNEPKSAMAGITEYVFLVRAGREKSVAATKTYTGQLMILYLVAHAWGGRSSLRTWKEFRIWQRPRPGWSARWANWRSGIVICIMRSWWGAG